MRIMAERRINNTMAIAQQALIWQQYQRGENNGVMA